MKTTTFRICPRLVRFSNRVLKQEIPNSEMFILSEIPLRKRAMSVCVCVCPDVWTIVCSFFGGLSLALRSHDHDHNVGQTKTKKLLKKKSETPLKKCWTQSKKKQKNCTWKKLFLSSWQWWYYPHQSRD